MTAKLDSIIFDLCLLFFASCERRGEQWREFVELGLDKIPTLGAGIDQAAEDGCVFEKAVQAHHAAPETFVFAREGQPLRFCRARCKAGAREVKRRQLDIPQASTPSARH